MPRPARLCVIALLCSCLGYCRAQPPQFETVSIQNVQLRSGERIVGLELHLVAGAIDSVNSLPVGWYFSVNNDPSWQTSVVANARVGTAALDVNSLREISFRTRKNEFGDLKFQISGAVIVTTDFVKERRLELSGGNLRRK